MICLLLEYRVLRLCRTALVLSLTPLMPCRTAGLVLNEILQMHVHVAAHLPSGEKLYTPTPAMRSSWNSPSYTSALTKK